MAQVTKRRRLVNPGGRRRMTPKQIKYFGTARQRAALKNRGRRRKGMRSKMQSGISRKVRRSHRAGDYAKAAYYRERSTARRRNQGDVVSRVEHAAERAIEKIEDVAQDALGGITHSMGNRGRRRNVGEILTVLPANPGRRRKKMAATKRRRRNRGRVRVSNRSRRRNRARARHRNRTRMMNPRVVVRYRSRPRRRHNRGFRRRNPDFLTGDAGKVIGVLGGAAVTGIVTNYLPANLTQGWIGYLTTGVVAGVLGQVAGKAMKNKSLGNWVTVGGLLIVGLQILQQVMPQLQLPFTLAGGSPGTSGMGLLTSSNFYVPQVPIPGSMASFVTPAGIPIPAPVPVSTSMHGLGAQPIVGLRSIRRVGRFR